MTINAHYRTSLCGAGLASAISLAALGASAAVAPAPPNAAEDVWVIDTDPAPLRQDDNTFVIERDTGPLVVVNAIQDGGATTLRRVSGDDGDVVLLGPGGASRSIEVTVRDGKVSIQVDGKEVDAGRLSFEDNGIIVFDEAGKKIGHIALAMPGGITLDEFGFDFAPGTTALREDLLPQVAVMETPTVMLGIHLGEPSRDLLHHLRLEPGQTTMVQALYRGLPAERAGLGEFDLIVKIDGEEPADPATLRRRLAEKEAGDVIRLDVVSRGKKRAVEVELDAYDAEAMAEAEMIGEVPETEMMFGTQWMDLSENDGFRVFVDPDENRFFQRAPRPAPRTLARPGTTQGVPGLRRRISPDDAAALPETTDGRLDRLNDRLRELERMLERLLERTNDRD